MPRRSNKVNLGDYRVVLDYDEGIIAFIRPDYAERHEQGYSSVAFALPMTTNQHLLKELEATHRKVY